MEDMQKTLEGLVLELRRGTLILSVLSQLFEKEYGYSLISKLQSKGFDIEAGTLYPLLRRLEKQSILQSDWDLIENRPRRYYQLSEQGQRLYQQLKEEYMALSATMRGLLESEDQTWKK